MQLAIRLRGDVFTIQILIIYIVDFYTCLIAIFQNELDYVLNKKHVSKYINKIIYILLVLINS